MIVLMIEQHPALNVLFKKVVGSVPLTLPLPFNGERDH